MDKVLWGVFVVTGIYCAVRARDKIRAKRMGEVG